ncbi:hypothetical protein D3C73_1246090 [compost metagenome]
MIYLLIILYALLMGAAALLSHRKLGFKLTAANLLGSLLLLCTAAHPLFLLAGLTGLLGCALRNGYVLQGRIRLQHVLFRCVISLALWIGYIR